MEKSVGVRIKAARKRMGLSQIQLAQQTRVSQPTVANWENGSHAPRHSTLGRIAQALDSSPSWLLGETAHAATSAQTLHHIPLLEWPQTPDDLDTGRVTRYVSTSTHAERPVALICEDEAMASIFAPGSVVVLDRASQILADKACYLASHNGIIKLRRYNAADHSLHAAPYAADTQTTSGAQEAIILARAVLSMQNH